MPDPAPNPYDSDPHLGMKAVGWAECDSAWRAWLASDGAVERVARALAVAQATHYRDAVCEDGDAEWWEIDEEQAVQVYGNAPVEARAVLAALRGDGDA